MKRYIFLVAVFLMGFGYSFGQNFPIQMAYLMPDLYYFKPQQSFPNNNLPRFLNLEVLLVQNQSSTIYHPNGERANYGDTWYHSNGERANYGDTWYHSNGERANYGDTWYHSNGERANYGDTWYYSNGNRMNY